MEKNTHPHFQIENEDGMGFSVHNVCFTLNFLKPYHVKHIVYHKIFTFKKRCVYEFFGFFFSLFLIYYNIHLMFIVANCHMWIYVSRTCHLKIKLRLIFFFNPPTSSSSIMPSFTNTSLKKHTNPSTIKAIPSWVVPLEHHTLIFLYPSNLKTFINFHIF